MSSVRDKVKLCSIDMNGVAVEKINGVPFYERYIEFDNTIKKHIIDRKYHNLFAQPVFNTTNGMIDWYVPANFQNAIKLSELKGTAEGDEYSKQKELIIQHLNRTAADLPDHDQKYFKCLTKYLSSDYIDDLVYCDKGQIIFGVWGLRLIDGKNLTTSIRTDIDDKRVYTINYQVRGNGIMSGIKGTIKRRHGHVLNGGKDIPNIIPGDGFEFSSWEPDAPHNRKVESDINFTAICTPIPAPPVSEETAPTNDIVESETAQPEFSNVRFDGGEHGKIKGIDTIRAKNGEPVPPMQVPEVKPKRGYDFVGWDEDINIPINGDKVFKAQYKKNGKGFWGNLFSGGLFGWFRNLFSGFGFGGFGRGWFSGCLSWIVGLLLMGLLIMLLSSLFRGCSTRNNTPIVTQPIPEVVHTPKQETPQETPQKTDDYEAIRALIQEYERRIDELEQMLPENQVGNNNKQSDSEYVQI